uniref:Coatomer subunit beta n=1 Tax=Antonospora locustae TaxID=278021 RepID=Q6E6I0_ANTLO|nr:coatomer complex beta subunit [Antonospora locustae]|eukprot:jgi/Antlo1/312/674
MATLYIDVPTRTKQEILRCVESRDEQNICTGIEQVIVQQIDGTSYVDVTHSIVRAVSLNAKSKALKKLFFYFIETFPKLDADGNLVQEALVFCNFLRQQLEHPNEFVRGRAIGLLAKLDSLEMVELLYKPLKDNLYHFSSYVRRNVYAALGAVYTQYRFEEIPHLLYECFSNETDTPSQLQLFSTLHTINTDLAERYLRNCDVQEMSPELLQHVLFFFRDDDFSRHCVLLSDRAVRFQAAMNLVESFAVSAPQRDVSDNAALRNNIDTILEIIKDDELAGLRRPALQLFREIYQRGVFSFKDYAVEILGLCDESDCELSRDVFSFAFEVSEPHEFIQVSDLLLGVFRRTVSLNERKLQYKTMLLISMADLVEMYGMYEDAMLDETVPCLADSSPELQFAAFQFLSAVSRLARERVVHIVLRSLRQIKFGKIFRYALNILRRSAGPAYVCELVAELEMLAADTALSYRVESSNIMYMAIVLTEVVLENKDAVGHSVVERAVALLLALSTHDIDLCTKSTVNSCIRLLIGGEPIRAASDDTILCGDNVLSPLVFSLIPVKKAAAFPISAKREDRVDVVQLTSLSDPLYCEANVQIMNSEVLVDVLCINQTEFDLHNVLFDFTFSSNLAIKTLISPFQMSPHAAREQQFVFRISEAMNSFVLGRVTFSYPDERKRFNATEMHTNLGEIKLSVLDFLRPQRMSAEHFRREWPKLEWENVYSLKFHVRESSADIARIAAQKMNSFVVNVETGDDFHIVNVSCVTEQGTVILGNVCVRKAEAVHFEARIRSRSEDIVKSLSAVLGETLRGLKD